MLSRAFGWAAKTPSITAVKSNPVADAAWSAPKSKKRKVLAGKEMLAVLDIARENNYLMYVFLIVLAQLSSRTGEAVALQWSDLDHDNKGNPIMHVNKSLAFRSANWMDQTRDEGIIMRLGNPPSTTNNPTREWVLKRTKTGVEEGALMDYGYLTPEIEALLVQYKAWQGEMIRQNATYKDMNFIFAQTTGFPITSEVYTKQFRQLLTEANIANPEQYDVYSLRHFSVSKKLDLNGNDFASVRSDTKHKETQTLVAYYDKEDNMEHDEYSFQEAVDFFTESSEERDIQRRADEILKAAAKQQTVPGENHPLVDLSQCSADERTVLDRHFENKRRKAQREAQNDELIVSPDTISQTADTVSPMVPLFTYMPNFVLDIKRLINGSPEKPLTPYDFTNIVLSCMNLRRYEERFYCRNLDEQVFRPLEDEKLRARIFYFLEREIAKEKSPHIIDNVMKTLKDYYAIKMSCTTEDNVRVFFLNGAYNMKNHQFEAIRSTDFFTTFVPAVFEPGQQCPAFDEFLRCVSGGDEAIISRIWEVIGYLLVPDMSAKAFFLLYGEGNTGKSVFGNLISSLFNPESLSHLTVYRFGEKFATSVLKQKRLNLSMDLAKERLRREAVGVIKQITGLDTISIEAKYCDIASTRVICKLMFCTNHQLMLADMDSAFIDRIVHIPFLTPIPKERQDPALLEKLQLERSAIVVKACDAYMRLCRNSYRFTPILQPVPVVGYVKDLDLMRQFIDKCCVFDPNAYTFTINLLVAFNRFAGPNVLTMHDLSTFSRQFNAFCGNAVQAKKRRRGDQSLNGYYGVCLKTII